MQSNVRKKKKEVEQAFIKEAIKSPLNIGKTLLFH